MKDKIKEVAQDILKVIKYNSDLPEDIQLLAIVSRLHNLESSLKIKILDELKTEAIEYKDYSNLINVGHIGNN